MGIGPEGQMQPIGYINDQPLFNNESQYEASAQNAVDEINEVRGEYFDSESQNKAYHQYMNDQVLKIGPAPKVLNNNEHIPNSDINQINDGDLVGYGWSAGGTASAMGGGSVKYYHLWDLHGNNRIFSVPTGAIGVDLAVESNFVWIRSVDGSDFTVDDFKGYSSGMNLSVGYIGGSWTKTNTYNLYELGPSLGILPFSITISSGNASPMQKRKLKNNITNRYLRTGGIR
jgi:hypothetical protein